METLPSEGSCTVTVDRASISGIVVRRAGTESTFDVSEVGSDLEATQEIERGEREGKLVVEGMDAKLAIGAYDELEGEIDAGPGSPDNAEGAGSTRSEGAVCCAEVAA